jgi:hypothetical protein
VITDYRVVMDANHDMDAFTLKVLTLIDNGWQPLGGIALHDDYLYQAMVKGEK